MSKCICLQIMHNSKSVLDLYIHFTKMYRHIFPMLCLLLFVWVYAVLIAICVMHGIAAYVQWFKSMNKEVHFSMTFEKRLCQERKKRTMRDLWHCDNEGFQQLWKCLHRSLVPLLLYHRPFSSLVRPFTLSLSLPSHLQTLLLRHGLCLVNMKLLRCQFLNSLHFKVRDSRGRKRKSEIVKEKG